MKTRIIQYENNSLTTNISGRNIMKNRKPKGENER